MKASCYHCKHRDGDKCEVHQRPILQECVFCDEYDKKDKKEWYEE